jgi:hypothetical protein
VELLLAESHELANVFALELRDELVETLLVRLDARRGKQTGHVRGGRSGVAASDQKQVCSQMSHLESLLRTGPETSF